jgi:hypothetical protein
MEAAEFLVRRPALVGGSIFGLWYLFNLGRRFQSAMKRILVGRSHVLPGASESQQAVGPNESTVFGETVYSLDVVLPIRTCRKRTQYMPNECVSGTTRSRTTRKILYKSVVLALTVLLTRGDALSRNTALLSAVATASARRAEVEQYVRELKRAVRPPDPSYAESRRRYFVAYRLNNEFITEMAASLVSGRSATNLATKASEVQLKTSEFTEYACESAFGKRRSLGALTHSATMFTDAVSAQKQRAHTNLQVANALINELQWRPWADIN